MNKLLTTAEAAQVIGVSVTSIKRWAEEGRITFVKTAGGHRRFELAALQGILERTQSKAEETEFSYWIQQMFNPNSYTLNAALLMARGKLGAWNCVADELGTALQELGCLWAEGKISVVEERLASERLSRQLAKIADGLPVSFANPKCLLACVEGDEHTLGLTLAELTLREANWFSLWTGRKTPHAELVELAKNNEFDMLAISASSVSQDTAMLARNLRQLEEVCSLNKIPLIIGGSGSWPETPGYAKRLSSFRALYSYVVSL